MKKKFLIVVFLSLIPGLASVGAGQVREEKELQKGPIITQSFASTQIRPGDLWKVYLNASDPEGEMEYIVPLVEQPGIGPYPISRIRVKKENGKKLSGYIYLNTMTRLGSSLNFLTLKLTVWLQDRSGAYSPPAVFPLEFNDLFSQQQVPPGVYKEQELGPIMVTLHGIEDGGGDRDRRRP